MFDFEICEVCFGLIDVTYSKSNDVCECDMCNSKYKYDEFYDSEYDEFYPSLELIEKE